MITPEGSLLLKVRVLYLTYLDPRMVTDLTSREYFTPTNIGDVTLSPRSFAPLNYTGSAAWRRAASKKKHGSRFTPANPEPLNRHDFQPRRGYVLPAALRDNKYSSGEDACLAALAMGKNNHAREIVRVGTVEVASRVHSALVHRHGYDRTFSLGDIIEEMIELYLIARVWRIANYDELICHLASFGPLVTTYQWYSRFVSDGTISTRVETPWGDPQGLTAGVISGYTANGMLLTIEHFEQLWLRLNYKIAEEDFVSLLNEGGEVLALEPTMFDEHTRPAIYR